MNSQSSRQSFSNQPSTATPDQPTAPSDDPVVIELRGKRLAIRTTHQAEFVQKLASYVDGKMEQIQQAAPGAPFDKLLMLVSLNLAEELFTLQNQVDLLQQDVHTSADTLLSMIDSHAATLVGASDS